MIYTSQKPRYIRLVDFLIIVAFLAPSCDGSHKQKTCCNIKHEVKSLMPVRDSTKFWFYIDAVGNAVTPAIFDRISYFVDGYGIACKGDTCFVLDYIGQVRGEFIAGIDMTIAFNGRYAFIKYFGENRRPCVRTIDVLSNHIEDGVLSGSFRTYGNLSNDYIIIEKDSLHLYELGTWRKVLSFEMGQKYTCYTLSENCLTIEYPHPTWGFKHFNRFGELIFSSQSGRSKPFSDGLAWVEDCTGEVFYVDTLGKIALPNNRLPNFDLFSSFSCGFAQVLKFYPESYSSQNFDSYREFNFINKQGELICDKGFERVMDFRGGMAAVYRDGRWGFIDCNCSLVIPLIYNDVLLHGFLWGNCWVENNGYWVLINRKGEVLYSAESTGFDPGVVTWVEVPLNFLLK